MSRNASKTTSRMSKLEASISIVISEKTCWVKWVNGFWIFCGPTALLACRRWPSCWSEQSKQLAQQAAETHLLRMLMEAIKEKHHYFQINKISSNLVIDCQQKTLIWSRLSSAEPVDPSMDGLMYFSSASDGAKSLTSGEIFSSSAKSIRNLCSTKHASITLTSGEPVTSTLESAFSFKGALNTRKRVFGVANSRSTVILIRVKVIVRIFPPLPSPPPPPPPSPWHLILEQKPHHHPVRRCICSHLQVHTPVLGKVARIRQYPLAWVGPDWFIVSRSWRKVNENEERPVMELLCWGVDRQSNACGSTIPHNRGDVESQTDGHDWRREASIRKTANSLESNRYLSPFLSCLRNLDDSRHKTCSHNMNYLPDIAIDGRWFRHSKHLGRIGDWSRMR